MKLFIKRVVFILCILCVSGCILEIAIRNMKKDSIHSIKNEYMMSNGEKIGTLILGSSHTYDGVNPKYLKPESTNLETYNLASSGRGLKLDYELLAGYITTMPNLKNLIIEISYFSFRHVGFSNRGTEAMYINYNIYMQPAIDCDIKYKFAICNSKYVLSRIKSYKSYMKNPKEECDSLGWRSRSLKTKKEDWDTIVKERIGLHTFEKSDAIEQNIKYLTNIIEICEEHSIRLVAVTTPTWHTYYNAAEEEQYNEIQNIMKDMGEIYNIEYYNLMKDSRFEADDFVNIDHLSNIGAEKFTKILADTLGI